MCKVEKTSSQARKIQTCCFCLRWAKPPGSLRSHQTGRVQAAVRPTFKHHVQTIFIWAATLIFWYIRWYKTFVILVLGTFWYFLHSLCKRQQRLLYNMQVLQLSLKCSMISYEAQQKIFSADEGVSSRTLSPLSQSCHCCLGMYIVRILFFYGCWSTTSSSAEFNTEQTGSQVPKYPYNTGYFSK